MAYHTQEELNINGYIVDCIRTITNEEEQPYADIFCLRVNANSEAKALEYVKDYIEDDVKIKGISKIYPGIPFIGIVK